MQRQKSQNTMPFGCNILEFFLFVIQYLFASKVRAVSVKLEFYHTLGSLYILGHNLAVEVTIINRQSHLKANKFRYFEYKFAFEISSFFWIISLLTGGILWL